MAGAQDDDKTMIIQSSARPGSAPKARLTCVDPSVLPTIMGTEVPLEDREVTFGRGEENLVVLKADGVSRSHARIYPGDGAWGIEDLGSRNGVYVNKSKVEQAWLSPGDVISIGKVHYKFEVASAPRAQAASIDISDTEKTMIMRPGAARPAAAPAPAPAAKPTPHESRPRERAAPARPAAAPRASSNAGLWVVVVVVAVAIAAGAFVLLG